MSKHPAKTLICLVWAMLFGFSQNSCSDARAGSLTDVGTMHALRASHSATLLPDGKVLIAGGFRKVRRYDQIYFSSAELYDPSTRTFTPTGSMHEARCGHTATLLQNGNVLIAGGGTDNPSSTAELYDPHTGTFERLGEMSVPREGHTATLLQNGDVLIAGGSPDSLHSAELFVSKTGRFTPTGKMWSNRLAHTATLLPNGFVLIAGGANGMRRGREIFATAELYDPGKRTFTPTGSMSMVRYKHAAVLLRNGSVLIAGGSDERDWQGQYSSAEMYDVQHGTFSPVQDMLGKRFKLPQGVTLLDDGTVLVSGGGKRIERFDPASRLFSTVAEFEEPHFYQTASLLPNGNVLIAGGYNTEPQATDRAWVYRP